MQPGGWWSGGRSPGGAGSLTGVVSGRGHLRAVDAVAQELAALTQVPVTLAAAAHRLAVILDEEADGSKAAAASRELRQVMAEARRLSLPERTDPVAAARAQFGHQ